MKCLAAMGILLVVPASLPSAAAAACAPGLVEAGPEGRCCLQGQAWSVSGCVGAVQPATGTVAGSGSSATGGALLVPVRLVAHRATDRFRVTVDAPGKPSCETPCELHLPAGRYQAHVVGDAAFDRRLSVFPGPTEVRIRQSRQPYLAIGIAGATLGGTALGVGAVTWLGSGFEGGRIMRFSSYAIFAGAAVTLASVFFGIAPNGPGVFAEPQPDAQVSSPNLTGPAEPSFNPSAFDLQAQVLF